MKPLHCPILAFACSVLGAAAAVAGTTQQSSNAVVPPPVPQMAEALRVVPPARPGPGLGYDNAPGKPALSPVRPAQGLTDEGRTRLVEVPVGGPAESQATHFFPSPASTVIGSTGFIDGEQCGYFWSVARGDSVQENIPDPAGAINGARFEMEVVENPLTGPALDWNVRINGVLVGNFSIQPGFLGPFVLDYNFAPIGAVGGAYLVRIEVTNEIPGGQGSHTLAYNGARRHSVTLREASKIDCACDGNYDVGDRVLLVVDNPDGNPDLFAGHEGTVICGTTLSPPLLVLWDGFDAGHDGNGVCDCPSNGGGGSGGPIVLPNKTGWYVNCNDVRKMGCRTDLNANGMTDFGDLLIILGAWGPCP